MLVIATKILLLQKEQKLNFYLQYGDMEKLKIKQKKLKKYLMFQSLYEKKNSIHSKSCSVFCFS